MPNRFRMGSVTIIGEDATQVDGLASIEFEYDIRDGRGHTMGYIWASNWPVIMDESDKFMLVLLDGRTIGVRLTSPSDIYTDMNGGRSLEGKFIEQSRIRED